MLTLHPPTDRFEISEAALLRDVVLAFQGVTGRHVLYDANLDGYAISPSVGVPPPTRSLVCKLTELGWLYSQLRQYCITCQADLSYGLTGQVLHQPCRSRGCWHSMPPRLFLPCQNLAPQLLLSPRPFAPHFKTKWPNMGVSYRCSRAR